VSIAAGYQFSAVQSAIETAIDQVIAALPIGGTLYWSQLYAIAYGVPGVVEVTGMTANGGTADIASGNNGVIVAGTYDIVQAA
jgi:uncharacterized phage protein gp47/JayE